jgi:hypothetical protein
MVNEWSNYAERPCKGLTLKTEARRSGAERIKVYSEAS